jgi:hypothetical protein
MLKAIYTADGNKQIIDTGHKTFDKQTVCISRGNVYAPTMIGNHIRAFNEETSNGQTFRKGELQAFDLKPFALPKYIREYVVNNAQFEGVWLYMFWHHRARYARNGNTKLVHGFLVTKYNHDLLATFVTGPHWDRSYRILQVCASYIVNDHEALDTHAAEYVR